MSHPGDPSVCRFRNSHGSYLNALEERIRRLESSKSVDSPSPSQQSPLSSTHRATGSLSRPRQHERGEASPVPHAAFASTTVQAADLAFSNLTPPVDHVIVSPSASAVVAPDAPSIDGMGLLLVPDRAATAARNADAGVNLTWATPEGEVYGESSGISFHRLLIDTLLPGYGCLAPINGEVPNHSAEDDGIGFLGLSSLPDVFVVRADDLPSRIEARAMREYFAGHTWQLYPYIDLVALQQTYESLLEGVTTFMRTRHDPGPRPPNPLTSPANEPIIALHFVIFALVQALTDEQYTKIDGEVSCFREHT